VAITWTKQTIFSVHLTAFFSSDAIISVTKTIFSRIVTIILLNETIVFKRETIFAVMERTMEEARVRLSLSNAS